MAWKRSEYKQIVVVDGDGHVMCECDSEGIADQIIRVCNAHADLLAALESIHSKLIGMDGWEQIHSEIDCIVVAAIKKAKE